MPTRPWSTAKIALMPPRLNQLLPEKKKLIGKVETASTFFVGRKQLENDEFQRRKPLRFIFSFQLQLQRNGVDRRMNVVKLPDAIAIEVMAKRRSMIARPVQRAYLHFRSSTNHLGNMKNCLVVRINIIQNHHPCLNLYKLEVCKRINPYKSWTDTTTYQPRNDVSIHFELDQCAMLFNQRRQNAKRLSGSGTW